MTDIDLPGDLAGLGWSNRVAALFTGTDPALVRARVVRVDRARCRVATATGETDATARDLPAVGDWVAVDGIDPEGRESARVVEVMPRWSTLARHAAGNATAAQVMAANIDQVLVVAALDHDVRPSRIERELVVAWDSGARPVVVLTKADRWAGPGTVEEVAADLAERVGVEVVAASRDGMGLDRLHALIAPTDTVVLIGPSGVGKSTLVNLLLGTNRQDTGEVREGDSKGRHTTIARHLLGIPGGGVLIDSPGTRELGLMAVSDGMALAFADIEDLVAECRFTNCGHTTEPGCAVRQAVADGELHPGRLESWEKLGLESDRAERRIDAQVQAAQGKGPNRSRRKRYR